jgi:hypothetical protein
MFLPDGKFDKFKARLVGGGDNQDKNLLVIDLSSPINVKTAYLNAGIDEEIYFAIDSQCSEIFCKRYPKYKRSICLNGTPVCLLFID